MKFTNGYWLLKPEFDMHFAVESYRAKKTGNCLEILCPTKKINGRGDLLNSATLTVAFSSPMENVIRVKVTHFKGKAARGPYFELNEAPVTPVIEETAEAYRFCSGELSAVIDKAPAGWRVSYQAGDQVLTESEYHGMAHAFHKPSGKSYMVESLNMDVGERVYGFGERFTPYVKNGQEISTWNSDGGTASEQAYKSIPFYMTNRGYGVFVENSGDVSFEVGSEKVERVQFSLEGEELCYDLIYGETPKKILERYTALTGRPALPPAWSFGLWLSTSFSTEYDEKTVASFIDGMAERRIPLSVFHFDCYWMKGYNWCDFRWDEETFPEPEKMLRRLKAKGLHICCWINPYIAQESPLFEEGMEKGYLLKKANGDVWQTDLWQAGMAIVDVTNPEARRWFTGYLEKLLDMGVDCFKTDFGERIPVREIEYFDHSDPLWMHNYYSYLYNKMVFECVEGKKGKGNAIVFARSATAGGQKYPVHWSGDNSATYASMAETLRSGLSISHSGFAFWSHDISGFEQTAPADVYKRWIAFGMLSSHSRLHGSTSYRVPWLFDEESCDVAREFTQLKCRLMPYLFNAALEAHEKGIPVMRPMMLEFPGDIACETCDTQYMLGESLLVAPVFHKDHHVDYYLPAGRWVNLLTGEAAEGGVWRHEVHGFHTLPLMVRENSAIPMGSVCDRPDYDYWEGLELHVYAPKDGEQIVRVPNSTASECHFYTIRTCDGKVTETSGQPSCKIIVHP
ncbi:MAG: alpha-xylosidase [Eubacteriales bacterium]|nr:alpha-xylosidase [Eubacteriales bacterium]